MKRRSINENDDSEDEAIWNLKPKKKATVGKSNPSKKQKAKLVNHKKGAKGVATIKDDKQKANNGCKNTGVLFHGVTPTKTSQLEGHCPFCQMPFSSLILESPRCHTLQCMDLPLTSSKECPDGCHCTNTIASHFRAYLHTSLAQLRSGQGDQQANKQDTHRTESGEDESNCESRLSDTNTLTEIKSLTAKEDSNSALEEQPCCSTADVNSSLTQDTSTYLQKSVHKTEKLTIPSENGKSNKLASTLKQPESTVAKRKLCFTPCKSVETITSASMVQEEEIQGTNDVDREELSQTSSQDIPFDETETQDRQHDDPKDSDSQNSFSDSNCDSQISVIKPAIKGKHKYLDSKNDTPESTQSSELVDVKEFSDVDFSDGDDELLSCVSDLETNQGAGSSSTLPSTSVSKTAVASTDYTTNTSKIATTTSSTDAAFKARKRTPTKNRLPPRTQGQMSIHSFFQTKPSLKKAQTTPACSKKPDDELKPLTIPKPEVKKSWSTGTNKTNFSQAGNGDKSWNRKCPFYKKIPGTSFTVDAFRFGDIPGCKAYFLTHFHYDHYGGLRKGFNHRLYCSKVTRNLVQKKIGVDARYLHALPMNTSVMVDGVEVTLLEANHCPGAVLFLFRLSDGRTMLHTGDFRASLDMEDYPALKGIHVNTLYLDTTYCDPSHSFPPQDDVIRRGVDIATEFMHQNPNGLIVVGSYTIGKERIFLAIAEALNSKVCVTGEKKTILDCLEDPAINKLLTKDGNQAKVHVLKMGQLRSDELKAYIKKFHGRYDAILAIEPTGWTHSKATPSLENIRPKYNRDGVTIYGLPYSEHSSYTEMKRFTQFIRPDNIIPTVNNGSASSRHHMQQLFQSWLKESTSSSPKMKQARLGQWLK